MCINNYNERETYLNQNTFNLDECANFVNHSKDKLKTGINDLDEKLNGGFLNGLIVISGQSGIGKTTLLLNLAYTISQTKPVLFFSLEMSQYALYVKLISHLAYSQYNARFSFDSIIRNKVDTYLNIKTRDSNAYKCAYSDLKDNKNLLISEIIGRINANDIDKEIEEFIYLFGVTPVVMVDSLQFLGEEDTNKKNESDKADFNILKLRELARKFNTNIFVTSFKESVSIESTADYLITIRENNSKTNILNEELYSIEDIPYIIQILKNKFGLINTSYCVFNKAFNTFKDIPKKTC